MRQRDYAILMMLAKLGLRAGEVAIPSPWMISTGDPVRCSFAPRFAASPHADARIHAKVDNRRARFRASCREHRFRDGGIARQSGCSILNAVRHGGATRRDLATPEARQAPYVYSYAEIEALLKAALALPPANGLRPWIYHHLFGLTARLPAHTTPSAPSSQPA